MKNIKTNYSTGVIDPKFYGKIEIYGNSSTIKYLTQEEINEGKQGFVLLPYVLAEHTEESLIEYDIFMKEYKTKHLFCPECGATSHMSTLVGYVLNWDKKDEYKDMNRCECMECGDIHYTHDRVEDNKVGKFIH